MKFPRYLILILGAVALLVGGLSVAPHLLAQYSLGDEYKGIPFLYTDNEDFYIARSQEILDGHPEVGSPLYFEYKDALPVQPPLWERLHAAFSSSTGLSLITVFMLAKFIFPAILFLLIAWLTVYLLRDETPRVQILVAITAGLGATIGYDVLSPSHLLAALQGQDIGLQLSFGTRPINPITGGIGLFACILMLWNLWKSKNIGVAIFAGLLLGFLNCYFFSWALGLAITGLLFIAACTTKDARRIITFLVVLSLGLLLNAEMFINFLGNPTGQALALRNGLLLMHTPLLNKTVLVSIVIFTTASYIFTRQGTKLKDLVKQPWWIFSAAMLLGSLAALNQQVLTGRAIWPYHFVQYTKPIALLVGLVAITGIARGRYRKSWHMVCAALCVFFVFQSGVAASTYRSYENDFRARQTWAPVFSWLKDTPKDSVVLTQGPKSAPLSIWIPAFTSNNVYTSPYAMSGVDLERLEHNTFVEMRFEGVSASSARAWLGEHEGALRGIFYRDFFDVFQRRADDGWFATVLDGLALKYAEFVKNDFRSELSKYRVDYVILDNGYASSARAELKLEEAASFEPFKIYRFQP